MSDVKRYDAGNLTAGEVVMAADYDALAAAHEQAWKSATSESHAWAREYEARMLVEAERDQLRAELEAIRGQRDVPLHAAVNHACGELPDGWSIEVGAERGGAWVTLYNAEMEEVEFPTDNERLDYTVKDAVEFALLSTCQPEVNSR